MWYKRKGLVPDDVFDYLFQQRNFRAVINFICAIAVEKYPSYKLQERKMEHAENFNEFFSRQTKLHVIFSSHDRKWNFGCAESA